MILFRYQQRKEKQHTLLWFKRHIPIPLHYSARTKLDSRRVHQSPGINNIHKIQDGSIRNSRSGRATISSDRDNNRIGSESVHSRWRQRLSPMSQETNHLRMRSVWVSLLLYGLCPKTRFGRKVQDLPRILRGPTEGPPLGNDLFDVHHQHHRPYIC